MTIMKRLRHNFSFPVWKERSRANNSNKLRKKLSSYKQELVEMDFRDLFLDNNWIDFSGSDGAAVITTDGISEHERRANEGRIT